MSELYGLSGKIVVVTRGSKGIGERVVRQAALSGARVIFTYNPRSTDRIDDAILINKNTGAQPVMLDPINELGRQGFFASLGCIRRLDYWIGLNNLDSGNPEEDLLVIEEAKHKGIVKAETRVSVVTSGGFTCRYPGLKLRAIEYREFTDPKYEGKTAEIASARRILTLSMFPNSAK